MNQNEGSTSKVGYVETLGQVQSALQSLQLDCRRFATAVESVEKTVTALTNEPNLKASEEQVKPPFTGQVASPRAQSHSDSALASTPQVFEVLANTSSKTIDKEKAASSGQHHNVIPTARIILTTYPGQSGIDPIQINWGQTDPWKRGPVVVSRNQGSIRRRNAIGAYGGSYSVYYALAVANRDLDAEHKPDFTNCEPAANIGPFPQWADPKKIVSIDPFGHLSPWIFSKMIRNENIHIKPTIAITKAHMKLPELQQSVLNGRLSVDGKICLSNTGELAVTKIAIEPVWFLPGVAERFGIDEGILRRSLFENTGGSFPELITRNDIKLFLPPIGGLTVYCFGDPAKLSDPNVRLALRVHDECNGSDVFGSDICTCRPYLTFGVEEAVKEAQQGGSGLVIYFRKEGRALGEVTKYLVYNARKRGSDRASEYFQRTENIAGVKDMRFQALMPDVLHWLGIAKIDRMLSMSNMKYEAIVDQGIPIYERVPIPEDLIPEDSRVEIDAKIHAGYFTTGKVMNMTELSEVRGRSWEDVDH